MKILIVYEQHPSGKIAGSTMIALKSADAFNKRGFKVAFFSSAQNKKDAGKNITDGITDYQVYSPFVERLREYKTIHNRGVSKGFKGVLADFQPDIVHFHNVHVALCYSLFKTAKKFGAKTYLTVHDVMMFNSGKLTHFINPNDLTIPNEFNYKVSFLRLLKTGRLRFNPFKRILIRYYLRYIDQIISVSHALKEALRQNKITNVITVHNGIDVDDFKISEQEIEGYKTRLGIQDKEIFFYCGQVVGQKGANLLINILDLVASKVPDVILLVTSQTDDKIISLAKEKKVADKIKFLGWLGREEIKLPFFACHLVIVPSVCFDSFPTVNLEAMAASKPVIATCFGGSRELVVDKQTGFIVNPYNIKDTAEKIVELLNNSSKARGLGQAGFERVKNEFSLKKQIDKILELYAR